MSAIIPVSVINVQSNSTTNVIPQMPKKSGTAHNVNFGDKPEKDTNNAGILILTGLIAGVTALLIGFRKNIAEFLSKSKEAKEIKGVIQDLLKNAEKKEKYTFDDAMAYFKKDFSNPADMKHTFIYRMNSAMKKEHKITESEAIVLGYVRNDDKWKFGKAVVCNKLDDKLIKLLGDERGVKIP